MGADAMSMLALIWGVYNILYYKKIWPFSNLSGEKERLRNEKIEEGIEGTLTLSKMAIVVGTIILLMDFLYANNYMGLD